MLVLKSAKFSLFILYLVTGGFVACGYPFINIWFGDSRLVVYFYAIPFMAIDLVPLSCNFGIEVQIAMNKHKFRAVLYIFGFSQYWNIFMMVCIFPKEYAIWGLQLERFSALCVGIGYY